ncbi:helix-turn-helix transcriptional regulator [Bacillus wiedmannii]|uniref:helix-turn-helix domain-containing protein n=1 Tax=Bacillus wiedmannii TaxID=1890302 RepID=UPI002E231321|nr:helix-turn-helix transcriptional regulator [Bacillus wiedmannii]
MGFIHSNLRVLMAEKGLNIQKVKEQTTLSRTTISNLYNNNSAGVQFDTMVQLCTLLNCQPGDIFTHVDLSLRLSELNPDTDTKVEVIDLNDDDVFKQSVIVSIHILCELIYKGEHESFDFFVSMSVFLEEIEGLNTVTQVTAVPQPYQPHLDRLELPHSAAQYIHSKLDTYLMDWAIDKFEER